MIETLLQISQAKRKFIWANNKVLFCGFQKNDTTEQNPYFLCETIKSERLYSGPNAQICIYKSKN